MEKKNLISEIYAVLQLKEVNAPLWPEEESFLEYGNSLISIIFKEELGLSLTKEEIDLISLTPVEDYDDIREYVAYDITIEHAEEILNAVTLDVENEEVKDKKERLYQSINYRLSTIENLTASREEIASMIPQKKISKETIVKKLK